ncbi:FHS family L-fucose permease-like MFS transporter [Mucilaginibacter frigoritolerans]|jgi:MFS transporter, FHS family, L-fucose permease|uniref:FHS family L-fucose permease-like MFS transporter n=1 Tax=Mucilaginibacter frigoritolerans TaxID=652788 RepID=A0A562TQQ5_9SPHI|nr:L-fucose:H+ symporter permease [Mucilaginibacter frigoritolerans]TWI95865.1 FHS family L-fucose permease-like MFS transporter [Mucilaginibacter frigoritolerans]
MAKNKYIFPFVLVTCLFFMWGFAYGLLDVLNKHFQEILNITKTRSTLLQGAYFGAYFLVAVPAGLLMNKYGYKRGIIIGLLLYATGAFLFYPAAVHLSFNFFLVALFILASGLAFLETAANPYVTVLGAPETSANRLNLSQCFNGIGSFLGPIIAAYLFFGDKKDGPANLDSVKIIYIIIGIVVLLITIFFLRTPLPEIRENTPAAEEEIVTRPLFSHRNFTNAVIAQFFYVAAQVGVAAFFINYCTENGSGVSNARASALLSAGLILFTTGRFVGTALMKVVDANKLLAVYAVVNILLCAIVVADLKWLSVYALLGVFFFESIMFPTIFALGLKDLGSYTQKASSFIIMAIIGGAIVPVVMGVIADKYSTSIAYCVPLCCFIIVAWYGWKGYRVRTS